MSAPFPSEQSVSRDPQGAAVFGGRDQSWRDIPERGVYVPLFYDPSIHPEPEKVVVCERSGSDLVPLLPKRTVADIAPEFRWVVRADGSLIEGEEFKNLYKKWQEDSFKFHGARIPKGWNAEFQPIPNPRKISCLGVDPTNKKKYRRVGYDPNATAGSKPESFYTSEGEPIGRDRMEMLLEAYQNPKLRKALKPFEVEEIEAHLDRQGGAPSAGTDGTKAKLSLLTELLHAGEITQDQYVKRVESLTGMNAGEAAPSPPMSPSHPARADASGGEEQPAPPAKGHKKIVRACGREIDPRGFRFHLRSCEICQKAREA